MLMIVVVWVERNQGKDLKMVFELYSLVIWMASFLSPIGVTI